MTNQNPMIIITIENSELGHRLDSSFCLPHLLDTPFFLKVDAVEAVDKMETVD